MTNEDLIRIAKKFIEDEDSCMHSNYSNIDLDNLEEEEIKLDIKIEFKSLLGICGCGRPEIVLENIYDILEKISHKNDEGNEFDLYDWADEDWRNLLILYVLDEAGLTSHGSSVYGSWISDLGKDFLLIFDDKDFNASYC